MFRDKAATVCIPARDFIFLCEVRDGKFLRHSFLPWDRKRESIEDLLSRAAKEGFTRKNLTLAVNAPLLRTASLQIPDMEEDDMKETLAWETDRLFRTEKALRTDFRILSHTPDRWEIFVAAAEEAKLSEWAKAARASGRRIVRAVPVTEGLTAARAALGICGKEKAQVFFYTNGTAVKRKMISADEEAEESLAQLLEEENIGKENFFWLRGGDAGEEETAFWTSLLPSGVDEEEVYLRLAAGLEKAEMDLSFPEDRVMSPFSPMRRERTCMLVSFCVSLLLFSASLLYFHFAKEACLAEEARATALLPAKRNMEAYLRAKKEADGVRAEGIEWVKKRTDWEWELARLAETMPAGVALKTLTADEKEIRLTGTAREGGDAGAWAAALSAAWDADLRLERAKKSTGPYIDFVISGARREKP